jgi:hypothetical protein
MSDKPYPIEPCDYAAEKVVAAARLGSLQLPSRQILD